jgi:hypothetical protein
VKVLIQCEGCEYPLADHLEEYENGEIEVQWVYCVYHEPHPDVPFDYYGDYDY